MHIYRFLLLASLVLGVYACQDDKHVFPFSLNAESRDKLSAVDFVIMARKAFPDFAQVDSPDPKDYLEVLARKSPEDFEPIFLEFAQALEAQFARPGQFASLGLFNYWYAGLELPLSENDNAALSSLLKVICTHAENAHVKTCESGASSYEAVMHRFKSLAQDFNLVRHEIGLSETYSLPITAFQTFRDVGSKPVIWIQANIHGDEHAGIEVIVDLIQRREKGQVALLNEVDFVFIPIANPDGYVISTTRIGWRKNGFLRDGVLTGIDLNRNYPTAAFEATSGDEPFHKSYSPQPAMAREIQALTHYAQQVNPLGALDFHSNHQVIIYDDLVSKENTPIAIQTVAIAEAMAEVFVSDKGEPGEYVASSAAGFLRVDRVHGVFGEWFRQEIGAMAFSVEMYDPTRLTTWPSEEVRFAAVEGARPAMDVFVQAALDLAKKQATNRSVSPARR